MPTAHNGNARIGWSSVGTRGPAVLLIMGHFLSRQMWHRVVPALADRYRVIGFDNRGVGDSVGNAEPFTIADLADDAVAVLDAADVDQAHVYGVSMGGLTAQEVALRAPDRVRCLVLGCTGCPGPDERRPRSGRLRYRLPRALAAPLVATGMTVGGADKTKLREDIGIIRVTPISRIGLRHQAAAIAGFQSADRVGGITAPTLVVHGDRDRVVPIERGVELAERIPGARFEALAGAGHNYTTDATDEANRIVREFLDDCRA